MDSSAWIECLEEGPHTEHFKPILQKLPDLLVPSILITEVRKVLLRQRSATQTAEITRIMCSAKVIAIDEKLAVSAADLAIQYQLPLADSLIYAVVMSEKATLWTQNADFKGLPHVRYFPKRSQSRIK